MLCCAYNPRSSFVPSVGHSSNPWPQKQSSAAALHPTNRTPSYPRSSPCPPGSRASSLNSHTLLCSQDLGSKDLKRERLFLVCQIIRVGRMDLRETLSRKLSTGLRRPFGISGEGGSGWTLTPQQPHGQLPDPEPTLTALPCSLHAHFSPSPSLQCQQSPQSREPHGEGSAGAPRTPPCPNKCCCSGY